MVLLGDPYDEEIVVVLLLSVLITSHLNQRRLALLQERVDEAFQTLQVYRPPIPYVTRVWNLDTCG